MYKSFVSFCLAFIFVMVSSSVQAGELFERLGRTVVGVGLGSLVKGEHRDEAIAAGAVAGWMSYRKEDRVVQQQPAHVPDQTVYYGGDSSGSNSYGGNPGVASAAARGFADTADEDQATLEREAYCANNRRCRQSRQQSVIVHQPGIYWN